MKKFLSRVAVLLFSAFGISSQLLVAAEPTEEPGHASSITSTAQCLALAAPILVCLDEITPCLSCSREPEATLEDVPVPDSDVIPATPEALAAPFHGRITASINWPAYQHGEPGQCIYGGCNHRPCSWIGDVQITTAPNGTYGPATWDGYVYWGGTQIQNFQFESDSDGDVDTVALNRTLPCDDQHTQAVELEIKVKIGSTYTKIASLTFKCNPCR
jgi:hypothetical protein